MKRPIERYGILLLLLLMTNIAVAGSLHVDWPPGWEFRESARGDNLLVLHGRLRDDDGNTQYLLHLTTMKLDAQQQEKSADIRSLAQALLDRIRHTAIEPDPVIRPLGKRNGYYFTLTDKAPKPGEFRQLLEAVLLEQGYLINVTLLGNDLQSKQGQAMLSALSSLSIAK